MQKYGQRLFTSRSLVFRICVLFLCVLIPLDGLGLMLFNSGYETIRNQIHGNSIASLEYISKSVSSIVDTLYSDLYKLQDNTELRYIAFASNSLEPYKYYQSIHSLQEHIALIARNNAFIDSIKIYLTATKTLFVSRRLIGDQSAGYSTRFEYDYGSYDQEQIDQLIAQAQTQGTRGFISDDAGVSIALLYPAVCYYQQREPSFIIQIEVSTAEIQSFLASRNSFDQQSTAIFAHDTDLIILGKENAASDEMLATCWASIRDPLMAQGQYSGVYSGGGTEYLVSAVYSEALHYSFLQMVTSAVALRPLRTYEMGLLGYVALSLLLFFLCAIYNLRLVHRPIKQLLNAYQQIGEGNYTVNVSLDPKIEEFALLGSGFNSMTNRLNDTVNQLYKQEIYAQRMELSQLQMQINPHFLFNSYFMMDRLLQQGDYETASRLSNYLGEFFRYINRNARRYIELSAEWEHMHSYAMIQQMRYARRLRLEIAPVPEDFADYIVPRLILQPIMENSVEHGLAHIQQDGLSRLRFEWDEVYFRVIVEDNGGNASDELIAALNDRIHHYDAPQQETTALVNIHHRLQLCYGPQYGLRLSHSALNGLKTEILLPVAGKELALAHAESSSC